MTDLSWDSVEEWLRKIGKGRYWLGDRLGASKHTVDGWGGGRNIPRSKQILIEALMRGTEASAKPFTVSFTTLEFEQIETARVKAGYKNRETFYHDAVIQMAEDILAQEQDTSKIIEVPPPQDVVRPRRRKASS